MEEDKEEWEKKEEDKNENKEETNIKGKHKCYGVLTLQINGINIQWPHTKIIHHICAYDQDF